MSISHHRSPVTPQTGCAIAECHQAGQLCLPGVVVSVLAPVVVEAAPVGWGWQSRQEQGSLRHGSPFASTFSSSSREIWSEFHRMLHDRSRRHLLQQIASRCSVF